MRRRAVVDPRFGSRMRMLREQRGLSLRDLEQPTLSSKSKLHNVETGVTAPSLETARLIDDALRAGGELVALVSRPGGPLADPDGMGEHRLLASLRAALAGRRWPDERAPAQVDLAAVEATTQLAHEVYQRADYAKAVTLLPVVVVAAEQVARDSAGEARRHAHRVLALSNIALSKLAVKLGDAPLAWVAADRAATSALACEDRALWGAAAYQTACALLRMPGRIYDAAETLGVAADDLDRTGPAADPADLSVRGALRLLGAVVAARQADRGAAAGQLAAADALATGLGEDGNHLWTGFGPTNVLVHRAGVAVELQEPARAIELGDRIDLARLPPSLLSRRAQVHLTLAAAFAHSPDGDPAAVLHLLAAERIAPQLPGVHHASRSLLSQLLGRERRAATPGLRDLARRAGVPA